MTFEFIGECATVRLDGEIDHNCVEKIRDEIDKEILEHNTKKLILDFNAVSFMDSSGIGLILGRKNLMKSLGGKIHVEANQQEILRLIRIAGI